MLSREIQGKYQSRQVDKYVFPTSHEFLYSTQDILPRSFSSMDSLGRVLYLQNRGNLQQVDVINQKSLSPLFLGSRVPFLPIPIIDMAIDSTFYS